MIRNPVYSFYDFENLTRYLHHIIAYYVFSKSNLYRYVLLKTLMIFKEAKPPTPNHPTPQTHSKKTHTHGHTNTNISATKNIIGKATIYYEKLGCFLLNTGI